MTGFREKVLVKDAPDLHARRRALRALVAELGGRDESPKRPRGPVVGVFPNAERARTFRRQARKAAKSG